MQSSDRPCHDRNRGRKRIVASSSPAVGVFLGDRDDEAQVRLNHFLFRLPRFLFALLDLGDDAAEFGHVDADIVPSLGHIAAQFLDLVGRLLDQHLPAAAGFSGHFIYPVRIKFATAIFVDEF